MNFLSKNYLLTALPLTADKRTVEFRVHLVHFVRNRLVRHSAASAGESANNIEAFTLNETETGPYALSNIFNGYVVSNSLGVLLGKRMGLFHLSRLIKLGDQLAVTRELFSGENPSITVAIDDRYFSERRDKLNLDKWGNPRDGSHRPPTRLYPPDDRRIDGGGCYCDSFSCNLTEARQNWLHRLVSNHSATMYPALAHVAAVSPGLVASNARDVFEHAPLEDLNLAELFILAACSDETVPLFRQIEAFLDYRKSIVQRVREVVVSSDDVEEIGSAVGIVSNDLFWIESRDDFYGLLRERLARKASAEVHVFCVETLVGRIELRDTTGEVREAVTQLVDALVHSPMVAELLTLETQRKLCFACMFFAAEEALSSSARNAFRNAPAVQTLIDAIEKSDSSLQLRLAALAGAAQSRNEHRLALHLMNLGMAEMIDTVSNLGLAETYLVSLEKAIEWNERVDDLLATLPVFRDNLSFLELRADAAIRADQIDRAATISSLMEEIEPLANATVRVKSFLEQRILVASMAGSSFDLDRIDELSGVGFELLLQKKLEELGFDAKSTPGSGDFGADLVVEDREGTRVVVQCKRYGAKVNLKAVQEVVGALGHYSADFGIVVTNNEFLPSAVKLAQSNQIELWDGKKLRHFFAGELDFSILNTLNRCRGT